MTSRWSVRLALLGLVTLIGIVTGCTPASVPTQTASATRARTPLVVIPASAKTYSDRGVVAWKVYPYLSGKIGGFTVVGVDTKSNVKRVTRVFDVAGKVQGAPAKLVFSPLYPKSSARAALGNTGLYASTMSSNTKARHIADVVADATAYLPNASTQGSSCSTHVKRLMSCLAAPSMGDLSARWTQVRTCRLAMAHLVKPTTCITHSVKLKVPSGATAKTKDGDDDDMVAGDDDDDGAQTNDTQDNTQQDDGQQDAEDNQAQQDQQQDAQQDAEDNNPDQSAQNAGDFTPGTDDNQNAPSADDTQQDAQQDAQDADTGANGLNATETAQAQGNDPIPSAGDTTQTQNDTASTGCGTTTDSLHVLTAGVCTAPTANATPTPTADQGNFGATSSQATCTTDCAEDKPAGTVNTNDAQVPIPTTKGLTVQASATLGTLNVNASVTSLENDPDHVYLSLGGGVTTQLASASVGAGPIVVHGDPDGVLKGSSVVTDGNAGYGIGGVQAEVQKNSSGYTVSLTGQVGPSMIPASVGAGMSYGWKIPVPRCDLNSTDPVTCMGVMN